MTFTEAANNCIIAKELNDEQLFDLIILLNRNFKNVLKRWNFFITGCCEKTVKGTVWSVRLQFPSKEDMKIIYEQLR